VQVFRVFLKDGRSVDIEADTYGREGSEWVLYDSVDLSHARDTARFDAADVNAITLVKSECDRLLEGADLNAALAH
jgi:hypothetical protein